MTKFRTVSIMQGQYRVSSDPGVMFSTVLESCVSVCLFDDFLKIGGMNHYLLPNKSIGGQGDIKFGALAIELLVNELLKSGACRSRLSARLFGGATMLAGLGDIGARNARFALDMMQREGYPIAKQDLGGRSARRLHFHPVTGQTKVARIAAHEARDITLLEKPMTSNVTNDVTLF